MAKKKKINQSQYGGKILGRVDEKGNKIAFIQNPTDEEDIAPVKQTNNTWFKKGTLDDSGYAIENPIDAINRINAGILMTGVDALGQFGRGFLGSAEGVTDIAKTTTADVLDFFGADNKARKLRESAERTWGVNEQLDQALASDNGTGIDDMSFLGEKGKTVPQGLGTTMFSMTTGGLGGALLGTTAGASATSMALLGMSAAGNSEQEAIKEMKAYQDVNGFSDKEIYKNAKLYGVLSGTAEALTEMMFGAAAKGSKLLGIGTGMFDEADDYVIHNLTKRIQNNLVKTFTQAGLKATSEGFEEVASGLLNAFAKKITYQKDKKYWDELVKDENLLDSFLSGTFSAALSQAPGVAKHITTVDENGKLRLKSNNEIKDYITDLSTNEQKIADKVAESRFTEEMTNKEKSKIRKEVMDQLRNLELTSDEINKSLGDEIIQGEPADTLLHQIIQNENTKFNFDEAELQVDNKRVNKNATNVEAKIQQLANDFTNELNDIRNTTSAHKLFNEMKNVIQATGEQVRLTSYNELEKQGAVKLLTDEKGNPIRNKNGRLQYTDEKGNLIGINGFRSKDGIVLNSDSTRLFEATMGHEIGESIKANSQSDYKVLREIATELGKLDGTLTDETMKAIERTYGTLGERTDSYLDEYVNDKLGELFTKDSELINRIGQKPTILRKIIDEVKYLVKRFTTKSAEGKKLLELQHNLENKLQESIRELNVNNKTQQGTQYSLSTQQQLNDITNQRDSLRQELLELRKERGEITKTIPDYSMFKQYDELTDINKRIDDNLAKSKELYAKQEELKNKLEEEKEIKKKQEIEEINKKSTPFKEKQFKVLQKSNPMLDDYHTGIRQPGEIMTWEEAINDADKSGEGYSWGDYTKEDALRDLDRKRVTIYSSYPIKNGTFVTPSKAQAEMYAGGEGSFVYSKTVNPDFVAWINVDEGQYANVGRNIENNTKYSLTDNQGRELSKEQQEYFKDSKVRDDEGNLKVMYHGTPDTNFTIFENNRVNSGAGLKGLTNKGFYFTDTKLGAEQYAIPRGERGIGETPGVKEVYLNMTNPLVVDSVSKEGIKQIKDFFGIKGNKKITFNNIDNYVNKMLYDDAYNLRSEEQRQAYFDSTGYDGVILKGQYGDEYVVFNSNQIKNVDNTNPTSNPDIRYSLSESNSTEDSQGRQLSEQQQEYFKDSKVRDENGNLMVMNHATADNTFTVFEKNTQGKNSTKYFKQKGGLGEGFYFSDEEMAYKMWNNYVEQETQKPVKSMKVYLDIKNPYYVTDTEISKDIKSYINDKGINPPKMKTNRDALYFASLNDINIQNMLKELGYDGIIERDTNNIYQAVAFESNQIKNIDNTNPTSNPDIRYSLSEAPKQDNQGRQLSKEQQEFYRNVAPQLLDEKGSLKTFYHGTPTGDFTVFNEGSYFSEREEYATGYQNPSASSISYGKQTTTPKTYEVYLNITNPFTLSNQTAKDIYINEYIKGGNSAYYDPYTDYTDTINQLDEIDWVEGEDLKEWLQENHPEYDGLILDEGGDGGYGEAEYRWRGLSYVPFNSNQIKNVDNLNPTSNPDIRYSLSESNSTEDSQGRTLTKEQLNYFKDSKVLDQNGNLQVMYNGRYSTDNVFNANEWTKEKNGVTQIKGYFATDSDYSSNYGDVGEYYLDIKNPLYMGLEGGNEALTIDEWKQFFEDKGITGVEFDSSLYSTNSKGNETPTINGQKRYLPFEIVDSDEYWVGNGNVTERIKAAGYDGLTWTEGGQAYMPFNQEAIKNIDNTNPTSNPDIRYSLSDNGEMVDNNGNKVTLEATEEGNSGTLMVLHNLGEDKFNGVLDLGGIPVPSLAVTNPNIIDHNQFGEGTLIFDKSTIDPAIEANEVYDRDVWSPTIRDNVQIDYEINDDAIETTAEKLGIEAWRLRDAVEDNKPEYLAERLLREEKLIDKYVTDNNIKYETAYKDAETKVDMHQRGEKLRKFIIDNDFDFRKLYKDSKLQQEYFDLIKDYYDNSTFPPAVKENLYNEKITQLKDYIDFQKGAGDLEPVRQLKRYQDDFDLIKSGENKVIDEWQTEKNKKQAAIDNGIEEYLKQQTKDVYGEKGIRNDVELFTNSGNRRSFWALHDEYNLDNLVEALTKGETTGTQHFGSGYGQIQAAMANRFNSISDIKANEGLLTNLSENNEVLENAKANIDSDIEEIESNNDVYYDTVAELLVDFARGDLTVDNFKKLTRNDYQTIRNVSDSLIEKIIDDMETLKNLPTDYFEAKPQRALGLDEIQMAVIPNNWSAETKQRLTDMGIQYTEYDPSIEGDRQRVINQFDNLKFSLSQNNIAPIGNGIRSEQIKPQDIQDAIAPLQEQVQQLTDTITRLEDRIAPLNEQEADELYQETQRGFENEVAPIRENLTPEENQRMDMLELLEHNGMLTDERRYEKEQLENKVNPVYPTEESTPGQALSDIRDMDEIGKRDVKAYQFEHPEVKPYFQEEARGMLNDLNNSIKGERFINESQQRGQGTSYDVLGVKRFTSPEIAELLDSKYGYTYDDIRKGLNAIIEDHGAENIAIAKRIELVLDDNLRNGYTDWQTGMEVPPNQEYLNMLAEQEWQNYFDDINSQYPLEQLQEPQYNLEDEETDFSDVSIEPDLSNFTADDIDVSPFLEGLQGASKRQAERQQQREELNQKKEVKIPKQSDGRRAVNRAKGLLVNEFAVLDDYSKQTGNKDIKFKTDTYNNYQAIAQSNIETAQTDINGKAIGRSGNSIMQEAESLGLKDIFDSYLKHWANVDRAKQGKGAANYSAKESYKIVKEMEDKHPALKRLGKDMWQYYRNARHNLRDAGIISQEVSDMLGRMYPHYTPYISENIENYFTDKGELKPKATIKRAKGGAAIGSLLSAEEAMQRYTKSEFNTIFGNDLFREIVNTSNDIVQLGGDDRGMQFVNADNLYADKDGYYLTAYENGEPITARISEDMYRTLTRESRNRISDIENTFSAVTKPLQAASKLRRNILTSWSPTFIAKNFIKDFQEGIFNSKYTKDFIKNYPSAFKELATNTELAQQFKSLYGSGLTMGQYDIDANNYNPSGKNRNFLKGIKNANELIELAPRYAEFKASIDHGASIQEAMYNAREVTTNFSRGGTLAKALNRNGFTFLNSSIQGFDKFIRNFSGENGAKGIVNSLAKAAIFGIAPAVFNELAFGSGDDKDEEYEALPDYIKDNYYIIKVGNGNFIRIPKGRVLSVFGSAARRTIEAMEGEENAFEGYWNNVQQQIGINNPEENNIFAPLIQAMGGRKLDSGQTAGEAWYGGDIIPSRLQKERPEDQYDASIDKFSIWLGQHTGISPYKINYVLDQYTGGMGDIFLPTITPEANSDGSLIAPIKDQFTADTITDNKYVSEFYDTKGKLYTGSKATDEDVLKNKYMNSISSEMAKLYAERREVQADENLTKQQKYAKSQAIKAEINRLAKEGMDNYNDIIMSNNYAKIGDTEYYKNANGQWTKTTDDVASLGLDTEEKSEYYKVKNDIYTTKKENDGNDKPLVVQDIVNSNLTPDAKVNLYTSNYKDDLIQPLVDSGMDVDSYLTFKSQSFTADKDSNGKSISGSKKQKVFDYINSMDVPYEQKLILAKSEYNSFNDNNYEIIEYIENTGMDYDERIELYKALGFKVDGDSISW